MSKDVKAILKEIEKEFAVKGCCSHFIAEELRYPTTVQLKLKVHFLHKILDMKW